MITKSQFYDFQTNLPYHYYILLLFFQVTNRKKLITYIFCLDYLLFLHQKCKEPWKKYKIS